VYKLTISLTHTCGTLVNRVTLVNRGRLVFIGANSTYTPSDSYQIKRRRSLPCVLTQLIHLRIKICYTIYIGAYWAS